MPEVSNQINWESLKAGVEEKSNNTEIVILQHRILPSGERETQMFMSAPQGGKLLCEVILNNHRLGVNVQNLINTIGYSMSVANSEIRKFDQKSTQQN